MRFRFGLGEVGDILIFCQQQIVRILYLLQLGYHDVLECGDDRREALGEHILDGIHNFLESVNNFILLKLLAVGANILGEGARVVFEVDADVGCEVDFAEVEEGGMVELGE